MERLKIKARLIESGFTQIEVAREMGVTKSTISRVLSGKTKSMKVQRKIADILNLPFETVWTNN